MLVFLSHAFLSDLFPHTPRLHVEGAGSKAMSRPPHPRHHHPSAYTSGVTAYGGALTKEAFSSFLDAELALLAEEAEVAAREKADGEAAARALDL